MTHQRHGGEYGFAFAKPDACMKPAQSFGHHKRGEVIGVISVAIERNFDCVSASTLNFLRAKRQSRASVVLGNFRYRSIHCPGVAEYNNFGKLKH